MIRGLMSDEEWACLEPFVIERGPRRGELLSNLVFEGFGSCGDLALVSGFDFVFEGDASDDFGELVKAAWFSPVLLSALPEPEHHVQRAIA